MSGVGGKTDTGDKVEAGGIPKVGEPVGRAGNE